MDANAQASAPAHAPSGDDRVLGELDAAARAAPYRLVAALARGKRVLDAGCGTGEGCVILAAAGAGSVAGVDPEQAVIEAVRGRVPDGIDLARAEPGELPHPDASFDLVTCFDAAGPAGALPWVAELARVLAPEGLLAVSAGAAEAADLERELAGRLPNMLVLRRRAWVALALLAEGASAPGEARVAADPDAPAGDGDGVVVLASASPLPPLPQLVTLARPLDEARVADEIALREAEIRALAARITELESVVAERDELRRLLTEAEQLLAEMPELRRRSAELERLSSSAEWRIATALRAPGSRAEGMWLPAARRRVKQVLGSLIRLFGSPRNPS
jgi:SAM-dependent methyltransferase